MARDYKREYKKFQSSPSSIKKRSKLNKINRDKGTYGNGDNKDVSHMSDGSVVLESPSKNRGNKTRTPGDRNARGSYLNRKNTRKAQGGGFINKAKKHLTAGDGMLGLKDLNLGKNLKGNLGIGLNKIKGGVNKRIPKRNLNLGLTGGYSPREGFSAKLGLKKKF
tara:strand:- start:72 stop:566 length:495 start_codon:yes stop_codon:yes gene_type:complete